MAGPSLSHILDPPRPDSRRAAAYSTPPSYSHAENPWNPQHQQRLPGPDAVLGSVPAGPGSPTNTRKLNTPPVSLPPPTPASSTLQVRPAPPSATATTVAPTANTIGTTAHSTNTTHTPAVASTSTPSSSASTPAHGSLGGRVRRESAGASSAPTRTTTNHRGTNLYACRDCGRSYSRPEHLVRHVQTHTLGRRFVCDICQKSFARKDLLRRHVANHDNDSPKKRRRTATSPGAGRVSHACRSCAIARVKCDDTKPCKRCVTRKLTCVSTETPSTAAMHLLHLSASAHSSAANANGHDGDSDGPVSATDPSVAPPDTHSPGPFTHQQPRSAPAPHSAHEPASQQQLQQQYPYIQHARTPSAAPSYSSHTRLSSHEPRLDYPPLHEDLDPATSAMDPNRLPFSDFLRTVIYENHIDPAGLVLTQGLTILDFCDHASLELSDDDFGVLDHWNADGSYGATAGPRSGYARESSSDITHVRQGLVNMWTNSSWSPEPRSQEGGYRELNTTTTGGSDSISDVRSRFERIISEKLERSARDRILAIVLNTSRQGAMTGRLASSFPSVEVIDILIQNFLASLVGQASEWIHLPTFVLNAQSPEWLAVAAAAGAAMSPNSTLRKFGFILQDAARATLPSQLEPGSTAMQDVALVQTLLVYQEIGLWSANRRRMELAQSHLFIPVTMMRYRNKFQWTSYPTVAVEAGDEGPELDRKWKKWVDGERWKRLVFHCFLRDAECSMATLTNPSMSYAEITLPIPGPRDLWLARSASEWKAEYLQKRAGQNRTLPPSLSDLLCDAHLLPGSTQMVDVQFAVSVYLHGFWGLVLEYQRLSSVQRSRSYTGGAGGRQNLLLGSRYQELAKELENFHLMTQEWPEMTVQEHLLLHFIWMNLHASLDDIQLFAGKEGVGEARRVYAVLQQWASASEARSAVWCAGQVLRYAKAFPPGHLKDFNAVAVQQATLVLWAYGVVGGSGPHGHGVSQTAHNQSEAVYVDGPETGSTQRFISFGQGRPMVRGPVVRDSVVEARVENPQACMAVVMDVLDANFKDGAESMPPMVANLCHLMSQLGEAAWAAGLGPS